MREHARETEATRSIFEYELNRYRAAAQLINIIQGNSDFVIITPSRHRPDGSSMPNGLLLLIVEGDMVGESHGGTGLLDIAVEALMAAERTGYEATEKDIPRLAAQEGTSAVDYIPRHRLGDEPIPAE